MPGFTKKPQEIQIAEHGIGGGNLGRYTEEVIINELISGLDNGKSEMEGVVLASAALESIAHEQESFFKTRVLLYDTYLVQRGDNISQLAINFGLNQDTLISTNKITNTRLLQIGKILKIPNQDGILHAVKNNDTLSSIADKYNADTQAIQVANELFSEKITAGTDLFIPGAKLDWVSIQEINGDLFIWPVSGAVTSPFGYRRSPFNDSRTEFHSGIDIRGSTGTPIRAAMSGRVSRVGFDNTMGNFVIINHHSGYSTLYGHMSVVRVRSGAYVGTGERIGDVGSTGLSTGPHLHFTVYKNGVVVNPRSLMN
ncbi:MAG: M23 family metallopeptidase [Treponema sp.]|nr:M23 family metallopeptidase [Treponema sp.]